MENFNKNQNKNDEFKHQVHLASKYSYANSWREKVNDETCRTGKALVGSFEEEGGGLDIQLEKAMIIMAIKLLKPVWNKENIFA